MAGKLYFGAHGGGRLGRELWVSDGTFAHATMDESSIYFSNDGTFQKEPFARLTPAVIMRLVVK